MAVPIVDRDRYRPAGFMKWRWLPLFFVLPLIASLATAIFLYVAFISGFYWVLILPFLVSGVLAGMMYLLTWISHCRRSWFVGLISFIMGTSAFLGYFYLDAVGTGFLPRGFEHRVDLLPHFIVWRMNTDVSQDAALPANNNPQAPDTVDIVFNWFAFVIEFGAMALVPAFTAGLRARRAYCVESRCWMDRDRIPITAGQSAALAEALEQGDLERFQQLLISGRSPQQSPLFCTLEFANVPDRSPLEFPIYFSVEDTGFAKRFGRLVGSSARPLRQVELEPQEALTLKDNFTEFSAALARTHEELANSSGAGLPLDPLKMAGDSEASLNLLGATESAEIAPVPAPYGGTVFTKGHVVIMNLISLAFLAVFFGAVGLIALGVWLLSEGIAWYFVVPLFILSAIGVIVGIAFAFWFNLYPESKYSALRIRAAIARRPDPIVDVSDPESRDIALTPREAWAKVQLEVANDAGIIKVDQERDEVLMECDKFRYRIPRGSILRCQPECFFHPVDANTEHWLVTMLVQVDSTPREIIFGLSHTEFAPRNNKIRQRQATELCEQILHGVPYPALTSP